MKQRLRTFFTYFLPVLFVSYYSVITLFMHAHIENGVTIVHSHPFQRQSNGTTHHHSCSEIQLFNALSHINVQDGAVHSLDIRFFAIPLDTITTGPVCSGYTSHLPGGSLLRAPPASIFFI